MAVLVIYARIARRQHRNNFGLGDVIEVLPNGQHPGVKSATSPRHAFVQVPRGVAYWRYLTEEKWDEALGADGAMDRVSIRNKRRYRTTILSTSEQFKQDALSYPTRPSVTVAALEATIIEKSAPGP